MNQTFKCIYCGNQYKVIIDNDQSSNSPSSQIQNDKKESKEQFNTCISCFEKLIQKNKSEKLEIQKTIDSLDLASEELTKIIKDKTYESTKNYNTEAIHSIISNLDAQIALAEQEESSQQKEFWELMNEYNDIKQREAFLWRELNNLEKDMTITNKESVYLTREINTLQNERKRVSNSNIYNELLAITFDDNNTTIGGCRMMFTSSKLPNDEVNCGWGYIVFLSQLLALKLNYSFKRYELRPYSNFACIYSILHKKAYSFEYNGLESIDTVNQAMIMYLDALKEFTEELKETGKLVLDTSNDFLFEINETGINNQSIKLSYNEQYDEWKLCIKYILMILKRIINVVLEKEKSSLDGLISTSKMLKQVI